jgi:hypothetical protein
MDMAIRILFSFLTKQTPWPESASELYRPSDRHFSSKLVPTFADGECHLVSVAVPYGRILGFLDWSRYFFFQVTPQLYSRDRVDPFQTRYFSENLVVPGIEPEALDMSSGTLVTRPQRRFFFFLSLY